MRRVALFLALVLVACATSSLVARPPVTTLLVKNFGTDQISIYMDGQRVGQAAPGITSCIRLRMVPPTPTALGFRPLSRSWTEYSPAVTLDLQPGWGIELQYVTAVEIGSFRPEAPCK